MIAHLETERLLIDPLSKNDAAFILTLVNTDGWLKFIGNRNVSSIKDATAYIEKILANKNYAYNVFRLKTTNKPAGIISFIKRVNHNLPDIGFALLPEYEGLGLAYEAAKKYLDELIKNALYKEIIGITLSANIKSINLLKKLGLTFKEKIMENNEELSIYSIILNG